MLPKTVLITSSIVILLLAGFIVPGNFDMNAKGTLQPVKKQEIFAPGPGEVLEVNIDSGSLVGLAPRAPDS